MPEQIQTDNSISVLKIVLLTEYVFSLLITAGGILVTEAIIIDLAGKNPLNSSMIEIGWIFIGTGIFVISGVIAKIILYPDKLINIRHTTTDDESE